MKNRNGIEKDVIQIIPAPENIFAVHKDKGGEFYSSVVCMALLSDGEIHFCDTTTSGEIQNIIFGDLKRYNPDTDVFVPL